MLDLDASYRESCASVNALPDRLQRRVIESK